MLAPQLAPPRRRPESAVGSLALTVALLGKTPGDPVQAPEPPWISARAIMLKA